MGFYFICLVLLVRQIRFLFTLGEYFVIFEFLINIMKVALLILGFVILGAVVFLPNNPFKEREALAKKDAHLEQYLGVFVDSWETKDLPLGPTEAAAKKRNRSLISMIIFTVSIKKGVILFPCMRLIGVREKCLLS